MSGEDQNQGLMGWQGPLWTFLKSPVALPFSSHKERGAEVVGENAATCCYRKPAINRVYIPDGGSHGIHEPFFTNVKNDHLQMTDATERKIMYLLGLMAVGCTEPIS